MCRLHTLSVISDASHRVLSAKRGIMTEPHNEPGSAQHDNEFDRFDETQPFLQQLLADMLTRISGEPETDDAEEEVNQQEQAAG